MKKKVLTASVVLILLVGLPVALWIWEAARPKQAGTTMSWVQTATAPVRRFAAWGSGKLSNGLEYLVTTGDVRRRNEILTEEVARLSAQNQLLREALAKYGRLDNAVSLAEAISEEFVSADVIAYGNRRWIRSLEINRGYRDGLEVGDPVLHMKGLAGVVVRTGRWTSIVRLLNDPQIAVGGVVLPIGIQGLVQGMGSADLLKITLQDSSDSLPAGLQVVSSGMEESLYPRGLPMGVVGERRKTRTGQTVFEVQPAVVFDQIREVLVLKTRRVEEEAEKDAEEPDPEPPGRLEPVGQEGP